MEFLVPAAVILFDDSFVFYYHPIYYSWVISESQVWFDVLWDLISVWWPASYDVFFELLHMGISFCGFLYVLY